MHIEDPIDECGREASRAIGESFQLDMKSYRTHAAMADSRTHSLAARLTRTAIQLVCGVTSLAVLLAGLRMAGWSGGSPGTFSPSICHDGNPMFVGTRLADSSDGPAVLLFRDTAQNLDSPSRVSAIPIADLADVGSVYGVGYDARRTTVYVGSYYHVHSPNVPSHMPFGPAGYGGIYSINVTTGAVGLFASLPAGSSDELDVLFDDPSDAVGVAGLGDLDVAPSGDMLVVANLFNQNVYVLSVPDGRVLHQFESGARNASWRPYSRLFGVAVNGGYLFHGVIDSSTPRGFVYRSRFDGTEMSEVASFEMSSPRVSEWRAWGPLPNRGLWSEFGEPLLADISFGRQRKMIIGVRDRMVDRVYDIGRGNGDLLLALPLGGVVGEADRWIVMPSSGPEEFYRDDEVLGDDNVFDEPLLGSVASVPGMDEVVATSSLGIQRGGGVVWFDNGTGRLGGVYDGVESLFGEELHGGDIESLCPVSSVYLPITMHDSCSEKSTRTNVYLVMDLSSSMLEMTDAALSRHDAAMIAARALLDELEFTGLRRNRAAIISFNSEAWTEVPLSDSRGVIDSGLDRLRSKIDAGTRIDLALDWMIQELARTETNVPGSSNVVVLLTDGLPTGVPPAEDGRVDTAITRLADRLKRADVLLIAVGFGSSGGIGSSLLEAIASPDEFFEVDSLEALVARYAEFGRSLGCH